MGRMWLEGGGRTWRRLRTRPMGVTDGCHGAVRTAMLLGFCPCSSHSFSGCGILFVGCSVGVIDGDVARRRWHRLEEPDGRHSINCRVRAWVDRRVNDRLIMQAAPPWPSLSLDLILISIRKPWAAVVLLLAWVRCFVARPVNSTFLKRPRFSRVHSRAASRAR